LTIILLFEEFFLFF